jgi:hypothetical protein
MRDERALHRMQLVTVGKTFDCSNALALRLDREHQAGSYRVIVEDHRASAAHAVLTADVRPSQPAFVADDIGQRLSRLDPDSMVASVDVELDVDLFNHRPISLTWWVDRRSSIMKATVPMRGA